MNKSTSITICIAFVSALAMTLLLNSCSNSSKIVQQDPNVAVNQLSAEVRHLISCERGRTSIPYFYDNKKCEFTTQYTPTSVQRQKVSYFLKGTKLYKTAGKKSEVVLNNVEDFQVTFFGQDNKMLNQKTELYQRPHYAKLQIDFNNSFEKSINKNLYLN